MHHTVSATEKYLVGIESRMGEVESLLKFRSGDVCFIGIWGIGGIGKTTVARKYFDKVSHQFQGSCFLANVREESKKHGMMHLQKILLSRLLKEKSMNIASFYEGADMIKRRLCHWKVLIVFDDVNDEHQLEYLVGNHDWFGDGSIIITTTRNQDLLRSHDQLYSVPELAKDEAVELFSWHAFQKRTPDKEFLELSKSVVDYAKGLPLALKVLGSFLYKRGITEWRSALDRLRDTGYEKIVKQLCLSLDGLNHEEKNIFLDIACFFRGRKRDYVITILNSYGFRSEIGIDVLIQKSLIYISEGMVEMHDLIEQMGQQVARYVDLDKPWNHSRLWHEQDIKTVFSANQESIGQLSGISLLDLRSCENLVRLPASVSEMRKLKILTVKGCSRLAKFPENLGDLNQMEELYAGNTAIWKLPDSIGNLSRLKVLSLRRGRKVKRQTGSSLLLPSSWGFHGLRELKSLDLSGCNLSDNQTAALMNLPSLLELNLSRNKFISLPDVISRLSQLRYLNITQCQELKKLPILPPSIEELYAEDFLAKQSIARLQMYRRLNLVSFTNYSFDQQSYTEKSNGSSVLDEILSLFLSPNMDKVVKPSLNSDYRVTFSIIFPECAIPMWFKHQSVEEKILFKLPINWYNDKFKGFAICCVTLMGAGVCSPDSGLSEKYDYAFIKTKLICKDDLEDLKVLEKECKVGTASRTYGWCVCFVYIPLYASLQMSDTDVGNINQYSQFEASIHGRIVRQWGVHLIYEDEGIISMPIRPLFSNSFWEQGKYERHRVMQGKFQT
ncbi:hypothetical protein KY290_028495 [Solanum tuberosum]|uniref:ADP-ribosyl cyclase/cyclic ADP-ribose hydrolase n=1 Tax=Solanum tuberosum TaxID=4113 RepID=A0ABQ7UJA5_SOLTU|nr:hypothetical protein KY290_028495 [Solanum tuberosum]